jgi:thymidylate synthase
MQTYQELLRDVLENGEQHGDRTGVGTRSVFGRQWRHDMRTGFPLLTTKTVPLRWVFEELRWFLSGSTNVADLQKAGVDIWDEWATAEQCARFGRPAGDLGPVYGFLWRHFDGSPYSSGIDQITELLYDITHTPNSRRLIVTGWHPEHARAVALPPCHTLWQVKCHESDNSMSLHLYARSIDIFLGLPFNIASYAMLLKMISWVTYRKPRDLVISFGDLHLYNNHVEQAKIQLDREPRPLPNVAINYEPDKLRSRLANLLAIKWENIELSDYRPHPKIAAEVAV